MRISTKCYIAAHCMLFPHEYGTDRKVASIIEKFHRFSLHLALPRAKSEVMEG